MESDLAADPNDERAAMSLVWLLGWAIILPFAHPLRLLAYGLLPSAALVALVVLFPGATIFGPLLTTWAFRISMSATVEAYVAVAVLLTSFSLLTFLLCVWQRDCVRRFRDPLGVVIKGAVARFPAYLIALVLMVVVLVCGLFIRDNEPLAWLLLLPITWCYARLSLLGPLIASQGWRGAIRRSWRMSAGHALGFILSFLFLGMCWIGLTSLTAIEAIENAIKSKIGLGLLIADVAIAVATIVMLLWMTAVPALVLRRLLVLDGIDFDAFD